MRRCQQIALAAAMLASAACAGNASAPALDATPSGDAAACTANAVTLTAVSFGDTERYYIALLFDGQPAMFQLDTGSALTFLFQGPSAPPFTARVGTATIGCEQIDVAGRNLTIPPETVDNLPVTGMVGMDFLLGYPSLLDVDSRLLTRFRDGSLGGLDPSGAPRIAFDEVRGHALVPATLNGANVRLMFDTGAGHTLWVGQQGQPGDQLQYVQDAAGTVFPIYVGTVELALPPNLPPRTIPVARAPEFPYFEETVNALGGNLHGLLGTTAFAAERLLFDGQQQVFYVLGR